MKTAFLVLLILSSCCIRPNPNNMRISESDGCTFMDCGSPSPTSQILIDTAKETFQPCGFVHYTCVTTANPSKYVVIFISPGIADIIHARKVAMRGYEEFIRKSSIPLQEKGLTMPSNEQICVSIAFAGEPKGSIDFVSIHNNIVSYELVQGGGRSLTMYSETLGEARQKLKEQKC